MEILLILLYNYRFLALLNSNHNKGKTMHHSIVLGYLYHYQILIINLLCIHYHQKNFPILDINPNINEYMM